MDPTVASLLGSSSPNLVQAQPSQFEMIRALMGPQLGGGVEDPMQTMKAMGANPLAQPPQPQQQQPTPAQMYPQTGGL